LASRDRQRSVGRIIINHVAETLGAGGRPFSVRTQVSPDGGTRQWHSQRARF
jgi:hypothetical protein